MKKKDGEFKTMDDNWGKTKDGSNWLKSLLVVFLLCIFCTLQSCNTVNKHKSNSSNVLDTTGSTYINNTVVAVKDSLVRISKDSSGKNEQQTITNEDAVFIFQPGNVADSVYQTIIEKDGYTIKSKSPLKSADFKSKISKTSKDTASTKTTALMHVATNDSTNKNAGQQTAKHQEIKTSETDKKSSRFSWLWIVVPIVVAAVIFRKKIIGWLV